MGMVSVLARGLICTSATTDGDELGRLAIADNIACFDGIHLLMAPCSVIGLCCLYPAVVLTRPLHQKKSIAASLDKQGSVIHIPRKFTILVSALFFKSFSASVVT